jgi:RNA polymerase sigma-70 factor (ECF subfamily)
MELIPDDNLLVERIAQQDQTALALLYARYGDRVYGLTYRVLQNAMLAEEATQDVFLKVWRQSERWHADRGKFSSWLLTVARNCAIDRLRQEQRQEHGSEVELDDEVIPLVAANTTDEQMHLDIEALRSLMTELPFEQSQAIELAFFQGLSHSQLAERLNLPLGTVKARVRMGLRKLKYQWLKNYDEFN